MNNTSNMKLNEKIFACLAIGLSAILVTAVVYSKVASATNENPIETNSAGMTYGSLANLAEPKGQPDLIGAVATNGELGYMYYDDYYKAVKDEMDLPADELATRFAERDTKMAEAFSEKAGEFYGEGLVTLEDAKQTLSKMTESSDLQEAVNLLNDRVDAVVKTSNLSKTQKSKIQPREMTDDDFRALYDEAKAEVGVSIPVYKEDGVTQVGVFIVDSI